MALFILLIIFLTAVALYLWAKLLRRWDWRPGLTHSILHYQTYTPQRLWGKTHQYIGVPLRSAARFTIIEEHGLHKLAKQLRLAAEFQVMDKDFDQHLYLICDDGDWCEILGKHPRLRELIRLLFKAGVSELTVNARCLYVRMAREDDFRVERRDVVQLLNRVTEVLQEQAGNILPTLNSSYRLQGLVLCGVHAGWLVAGIVGLLLASFSFDERALVDWGELWSFSWVLTWVSTLAWLMLIYGLMRRSSRAASVFSHFCVVGFLGLFLFLLPMVYFGNSSLDFHAGKTHNLQVMKAEIIERDLPLGCIWKHTRFDNTPCYVLHVAPWKPGQERGHPLVVSESDYLALQSTRSRYRNEPIYVELNVKPGAFGLEWISHYKVVRIVFDKLPL